jgi:hypothetical protein
MRKVETGCTKILHLGRSQRQFDMCHYESENGIQLYGAEHFDAFPLLREMTRSRCQLPFLQRSPNSAQKGPQAQSRQTLQRAAKDMQSVTGEIDLIIPFEVPSGMTAEMRPGPVLTMDKL